MSMAEIWAMVEEIVAVIMGYLKGMFIPAETPDAEA